ncbi:hypothetical protein GCM10020001_115700 [Nonomuraea salmonea]
MAATIDRSAGQAGATIAEGRRPVDYVWAAARIAIGWIFLWAFLDKTFGWGFATPSDRAWIAGGSPTTGFLKGTGENALGGFFSALAGQAWVDWLFMAGLLGIGLALILGIATRLAALAGTFMLALMWAAELPPGQQPLHGRPHRLLHRPDRPGDGRRRHHPRTRRPADRAAPRLAEVVRTGHARPPSSTGRALRCGPTAPVRGTSSSGAGPPPAGQ